MPRLGQENAPGDSHSPIASAYSTPNPPLSAPRLLLIFFGLFILKNVMFHDYRSEEVDILKSLGQSEDQIEAIVPKTAAERRQKQKESLSEFAQMKQDIKILKVEVAKLRGTPWKEDGEEGETSRIDEDTSETEKS